MVGHGYPDSLDDGVDESPLKGDVRRKTLPAKRHPRRAQPPDSPGNAHGTACTRN
jgi:hypothetical protein